MQQTLVHPPLFCRSNDDNTELSVVVCGVKSKLHLLMVFPPQMPRSIFDEMKYLEVMIVSDHSMVRAQHKEASLHFKPAPLVSHKRELYQ